MSILNKKQFLIYNRLSIKPLYVFCIVSDSTNTQPLQYFSSQISEIKKTKLIGKALGKHLIDKNLILSYKTKLFEVLCHPQYIID